MKASLCEHGLSTRRCKPCWAAYMRAHCRSRGEEFRATRREYYATHPEQRAKRSAAVMAHNKLPRNAQKMRARWAVSNAIRDGRLLRPSACQMCGKECKPTAHHPDHSKMLEVVWLCSACHGATHRQYQVA